MWKVKVMTEEQDRCPICGELYYDHSNEMADDCTAIMLSESET